MPKRMYNEKIKVPCDLIFNGATYRAMLDESFLTFVDFKTGLYNRIITRDPITGLGTLPPIAIEKIRVNLRKVDTAYNPLIPNSSQREEYNCLYTKKDYTQLQSLSLVANFTYRDPISGIGITDIEYIPDNPVRPCKRPVEYLKRDPITHSVPLQNINERPSRSQLMLDKSRNIRRDPITHSVPMENMGEKPFRPALGSHDRRPPSRDFITHDQRVVNRPYTSGSRHFPVKRHNSDSTYTSCTSSYLTSSTNDSGRSRRKYHQHCIPPPHNGARDRPGSRNQTQNACYINNHPHHHNLHHRETRTEGSKEAMPVPDVIYDNTEFTKIYIRNPITHEEKCVLQPVISRSRSMSKSMRSDRNEERNPITHVDNIEKDISFQTRRKFPKESGTNPITHSKSFTLTSSSRPNLPPRGNDRVTPPSTPAERPLYRSRTIINTGEIKVRRNPITGRGLSTDDYFNLYPSEETEPVLSPRESRTLTTRIVSRNPITGEGFTENDYLPCLPIKTCARSCDRPVKGRSVARSTTPNHPNQASSTSSTQKTKPIFSTQVKHSTDTTQY